MDNQEDKLYAADAFFPAGLSLEDGRTVSADEIYNQIFDLLLTPLSSQGFKLLKSKKCFSRKTKSGVDEISISMIARSHFLIDFIFKKRIDTLQKNITSFNFENGYSSISNYKVQHSTWVCYSNIYSSKIEAIRLSSLKKDLEKLLLFIEAEILPYFEKMESLDFLNDTLNYPEKDNNNHFSYFSRKGFEIAILTGLICAKMLNDPNYTTLFNKYMSELNENEILKKKLLKLADFKLI